MFSKTLSDIQLQKKTSSIIDVLTTYSIQIMLASKTKITRKMILMKTSRPI